MKCRYCAQFGSKLLRNVWDENQWGAGWMESVYESTVL